MDRYDFDASGVMFASEDGNMVFFDDVLKERERWRSALMAFVAHVEQSHRQDQHNPYSARELWPDLFASADSVLDPSPETESTPASNGADDGAMAAVDAAVAKERERCSLVCDDEARIRTEAGDTWPEDSPERSRCYAAARAAINCAKGVRGGECV